MSNRYEQLGVSASKNEVHKAISNLDKGIFPNAFCKILPDVIGDHPEYCNIMHADTAGTKTSLAYLYWKETNNVDVWSHIAQDALVMNLDDLACIGCVDQIVISSTIGRNKHLIPFDIIDTIINANQRFINAMQDENIAIFYGGGETADVGDVVRTIDVGITAFCRMKREDIIINNIHAGQSIVGFASYGKASYENFYNSGIGSNGLTAARHDLLTKEYANQFPESYAPETSKEAIYTGKLKLTDQIVIDEGKTVELGKLLCSGTRTYLPVIKKIIELYKKQVHGIIHCSGGGQTKVKKFAPNTRIIKNNLLPIPSIFNLIREYAKYDIKEMYEIYNMGHRLEMYVDAAVAQELVSIAQTFGVDAKVIGQVESSNKSEVIIESELGHFTY